MSAVLAARAALGVASRRRDAEAVARARQELASAKVEAYVEKALAEAPPLTDAQKDRLVSILSGVIRAGGDR